MRIAARYIWGKTEKGYGWVSWTPPALAIEREGQSGFWGVYDADGSLLCRCADYRSAQRVVARIRKLALQPVTMFTLPQAGVLRQNTKGGWTFNTIDHIEDNGETFSTRKEAEAYIRKEPHPTTDPYLRSLLDGKQAIH
jgi:hypothetical protein